MFHPAVSNTFGGRRHDSVRGVRAVPPQATICMTKVAVVGDSGVGKTTWLYAMNGRIPRNIYHSTSHEQFTFCNTTPPVVFVAILSVANDHQFKQACQGCDAAVVLYNDHASAQTWLNRLKRVFPLHQIPILVCQHGACAHAPSLECMHRYPQAEHAVTSIANQSSIVDCANRIITRARRNLASPL